MLRTGVRSRRRIATFIRVTAVAGTLMLAAGPASASELSSGGDGDKSTPVRVVDRTFENLPVDVTAQREAIELQRPVDVRSAVPLPPDIKLSVGKTVLVNYRDGVAVHQAATQACTISSTAGNPGKSGNSALASHSHSVSSGCPSSQFVQGILESYASPWWHTRDITNSTVEPGWTSYFFTDKACVNSNNTQWKARNDRGSTTIAQSPEVTLACNPG